MTEGEPRLELVARLVAELKKSKRELARARERIAIVGMACRFPGGAGLTGFWNLLASGGDAVTRGRPDGLAVSPEDDAVHPFGAYVPGVDLFDAEFFRIAPTEAALMDPQQRMLLETSWEAIEDAGLEPSRLAGSRTGVFVGIGDSDYQRILVNQIRTPSVYVVTGTSYAAAAGRIAFSLGLEGPAVSTDTACSSSLVALHQAVTALQRDEADLALVGGVSALLSAGAGYALQAGGMLAPDGRSKTFDAAADGFGRGEGCGVLLLKRLGEAERDGDRVHAVLLGSAVNQDGASAGLTVPNGPAQERVIAAALARAEVAPASLDYLEAHGTGTELGDPIEVRAAAAVYGQGRDPARPLRIGSVKTNIGHLEAAAGVAGVIKVVLAMQRGVIPKHLHFRTPNPGMDWERLPLEVTAEATPWPASERPARAAVSSFGVSGTNAHVVMERYAPPGEPWGAPAPAHPVAGKELPPVGEPRRSRLLPLSGRTSQALAELADRYLEWLDGSPEPPSWERLSDAAWTAGTGRRHFGERTGVVFSDVAGLRAGLTVVSGRPRTEPGAAAPTAADLLARDGRRVAFLFTGQGSQWAGMGRDLYQTEPVARCVFDRCEAIFAEERGESLLEAAFGRGVVPERLDRTEWAQPALFALEWALATLWESIGITPDAVLGHSAGEIAAAAAAGFFGFEDGMRFATRRGALMGSLPNEGEGAGGMLAVFAAAPAVKAALRIVNEETSGPPLELAADNGAHQVVSGPAARLAALGEGLARGGIRSERLRTSHGFHSSLMDPILDELERAAPDPSGAPAAVALVSNVTGRVAGPAEAGDPGYWRRQARAPVRFAGGVRALAGLGVDVLVELGPRPVLGPLASLAWPEGDEPAPPPAVLASLNGPERGTQTPFLQAVSRVYEAGLPVAFEGLFAGERRRRVGLPTYPFQRVRHWLPGGSRRRDGAGDPLLGVRRELASGGILFENELDPSRAAWLGDCRAFGQPLAPAALHAALAVAAAQSAAGSASNGVEVRDLRVERHLLWSEAEADLGEASTGRAIQVMLGVDEGESGGAFAVFSRGAPGDRWIRHATARVRIAALGADGPGGEVAFPAAGFGDPDTASPPAAATDIYRRAAAEGLRYGPSLRFFEEVRSDGAHAVAVVRTPAEAPGELGGIRPMLFEVCFQLASVLDHPGAGDGPPPGREQAAWLPAGCKSLWLRAPWPVTFECHARVAGAADPVNGSETRTADVTFCEPGGEAFGGVRGLTLRRTTRARWASAAAAADELLYELDWRESAGRGSADFLAAPAAVAGIPRDSAVFFGNGGLDRERLLAVERGFEALACSRALAALERLGWEREAGARVIPEALRGALRIGDEFGGLFARLLSMLAEGGVLVGAKGDAAWRIASGAAGSPVALQEPGALAERLREDFPEFSVEIGLLDRCGGALAEVLAGRADALQLLFSGEPSAADIYREAPGYRAVNRLVAGMVSDLVAALPPGRRLSILEVGAGTGGTTGAVLATIPAARTDYAYTDISAGFFSAAERRFRDSPAEITYQVLDIERDPGEQGFEPHRYDVIVAGNVLHATRDLRVSLEHCRRLLAPSGVLVALEGTKPRGWADLTFGLLPGWWRFDDAYRTDYALVGPSVWRRALADSGYEESAVLATAGSDLPAGDAATRGEGTAVIMARGPSEVVPEPGVWVFGPDGGAAEATVEGLAAELQRCGQTVVRAGASAPAESDRRASWRELFLGLPDRPAFRGVVYPGAFGDAPDPPSGEFAAAWERVLADAPAMLDGLRDARRTPASGVWFITRGGAGPRGGPSGAPVGAALWGFGRASGQETEALGVRMLDVDPATPAAAPLLTRELLFPDRETEVAWRAGKRWVPRLVPAPAAPVADKTPERPDEGEFPAGHFREDRVYLVNTGLGRLGCELAHWLAESGAGEIVLYGDPPDAEGREMVERLRGRGRQVRVLDVDPSDPAAVTRMLTGLGESGLPPLGGVFHGADPAGHAPAAPQAAGALAALRTARGAWNLHRATLGLDLDSFVLFSGFGGVAGRPGPARSAAADAFLHHLARRRRADGLVGQAVAWGRWWDEEDGLAEEVAWMAPERGTGILARALGANLDAVAAGAVDWAAFSEDRSVPPLLTELTAATDAEREASADLDLVSRLRAATESGARERMMIAFLEAQVQELLRLPARPSANVGFLDLGMDSLMAVELRNRLEDALAGEYRPPNTVVFDHPNIARLAKHLLEELPGVSPPTAASRPRTAPRVAGDPIAVVGVAGRFPGAADVAAFARGLGAGLDGIRPHRPGDGVGPVGEEGVPAGYLEGIERFDPGFFGIPTAEAKLMEPQQRLLLETSWHALEDAGIPPRSLDGSRTGVYAALGAANREFIQVAGTSGLGMQGLTGSSAATAVGRIAYVLGLEGPAVSVDTSCSSSLVAVHQALLDLERHDTDLALAGGANVILSTASTRLLTDAGLLSASGRCSAFDAAADGYVRGEGCGVVVLKRLADAEAAGDRILAVIRGSAVNQDGARTALSAPAGPGQRRVMEAALRRARLDPSEVDYLEAHGIGSVLGDTIEAHAAAAVYGRRRPPERPLLIGSVKTNIGHLEAAAGVVSLIKAVLALRSPTIPPQLHFRRPNPQIAWGDAALKVIAKPVCWPETTGRPRRAAVSAFGVSGTNAHLILEAARAPADCLDEVRGAPRRIPSPAPPGVATLPPDEEGAARPWRLLPLSARSPGALRSLAKRYLELLDDGTARGKPLDLGDVAWSAGAGRDPWEHRAGLIFADPDDLRRQLRDLARRPSQRPPSPPRKVAFLFPGESEAERGLGRVLYETEPVARAVLGHCDRLFRDAGAVSLLEAGYGERGPRDPLAAAVVTAAAHYALEAALAALWSRLGILPSVVSGIGVGALTAGYAAGVFGLDDGLRLAALRGCRRGLGRRRGIAMLVCRSGARTRSLVRAATSASGGAALVVVPFASDRLLVGGPLEAVAPVEDQLVAFGEPPTRIPSRTALVDLLRNTVTGVRLREPSAALHHGGQGPRIRPGRLLDPAFWQRRVMEPLPAESTPAWPADPEVDLCIEVGPRRAGKPVAAPAGAGPGKTPVTSPRLPGKDSDDASRRFPEAVAEVWERGVNLRFDGLFAGERRRRIALPAYPFRRLRYWPAPSARPAGDQRLDSD